MRTPLALVVDGGNSKTDLALVRADGEVLALVRGPLSSPHHIGLDGACEVVASLLEDAAAEAGLEAGERPDLGLLLMAGIDFAVEEDELRAAAGDRGWAARTIVGNDTFAILRAGTDRGWGIAVVCGAGINCIGVAPDGRQARFPALGPITGDWGGGYDVGLAALVAAARSEDGRGPRTSLERAVPAWFGLGTPSELAEAIHRGPIELRRVAELPPLVFAEAADDAVAAEIVDRLAAEVVTLVRVALERLGLTREIVDVVLGGGLLRSGDARLLGGIEAGLAAAAPRAAVRVAAVPPVVGAALLALDDLGAGRDALARAREGLEERAERLEAPAEERGEERPRVG